MFGERDATRRQAAIRELYADDVVVYEQHAKAAGHAGVDHVVEDILSKVPPSFVFGTFGPGIGHHDVGRLRWHFGPEGGPPVVTGLDVVQVADNRIKTLHVFLDGPVA